MISAEPISANEVIMHCPSCNSNRILKRDQSNPKDTHTIILICGKCAKGKPAIPKFLNNKGLEIR